jgi:hypothetical protein
MVAKTRLASDSVRIKERRRTGKIAILKSDTCPKQLRQGAGLPARKSGFDAGDDVLGRQLAVPRHLAKRPKRLLLGLRRTSNSECCKYKQEKG